MSRITFTLAEVGSIRFYAEVSDGRVDLYAASDTPYDGTTPRQLGVSLMFGDIDAFESAAKAIVAAAKPKKAE